MFSTFLLIEKAFHEYTYQIKYFHNILMIPLQHTIIQIQILILILILIYNLNLNFTNFSLLSHNYLDESILHLYSHTYRIIIVSFVDNIAHL